ncbi:MAG: hypothetical protein K9H26_16385 [Prolixibacteraceae bacterium]|nr:hypothetical protein [Prolixibacteraceae bacterium]
MLGYDRPLKPEWIYKSLKLVEPGKKPTEFYDAYNDIAVELTGKDGRRKTRTVLFRTFIYSFQDSQSLIEDNILIELSKQNDFDYMKPIYMAKFMLDYEVLAHFTKVFFQIFDPSQTISTKAITAKMVEKFGDLEIVKRSTRAFIKTLTDFKLIVKESQDTFHQLPKKELNDEQIKDIINLYSICQHTKQLNLKSIDIPIFAWYKLDNLSKTAQKFHSRDWEYVVGSNRELIMIK